MSNEANNDLLPTLLIIDDDENILKSLERLLVRRGFSVTTMVDPTAALAYLEGNTVDAIVSDLTMPKMDGMKVLAEARRIQPGCRRILLTGFGETLPRAETDGLVHEQVGKPWVNAELVALLKKVTDLQRKDLA